MIARFLRSRGLEARDYARLLDLSRGYGVAELQTQEGDWVGNRPLRQLRLHDEGVLVLGIRRGRCYIGVPGPETWIFAGDVLVLYGRSERVSELDDRRGRPAGDAEHKESRADQDRVSRAEAADADRISVRDPGSGRAA